MEFIRTGSTGLDILLGGGWPVGTLCEIWGDSGSGKTILAKHAAENAVRSFNDVLWIDTGVGVEHMDDAPYVIVGRPRNAEQAFQMAMMAAESAVGLVVLDSANGLVRQREIDGDETYVPHPQREYKDELTALKRALKLSGTTALFVSQPRDKQREPIRGTGISEKAQRRVVLTADVVHQDKSREVLAMVVERGNATCEAARFTIRPGTGIDWREELVRLAVDYDVIQRHGNWFHLTEGRVRQQGVRAAAAYFKDRPYEATKLEEAVRAYALGHLTTAS